MKCNKCNSEINNEAKYCPICGTSLDLTNHLSCSRCSSLISKNDRFCKNCGYDVKNSRVSSFEVLNKFNFLKLSNYKVFTSVLMLILSVVSIVCLFLPLFKANYNSGGRNLDLFKTLLTQEVNVNGIKLINLPYILKMLFSELTTKKVSIITYTLANHMGVFAYTILSILFLTIGFINIAIIVLSILGIIKKTFKTYIKKLLVASLVISLSLSVGLACDGIGAHILVILPILGFIYFFFMEAISKENLVNPTKIILKAILLVLMTILLVSLLQGSDYTSYVFENRIPRFNYEGKYISGIISQIFLKMMFITDSRYTLSMTTSLNWTSSVILTLSIIFLVILCYAYAKLLLSFSNETKEIPTKELLISFIIFVAFFAFELAFADYLNVLEYRLAVSEDLSYYDMHYANASAYEIFFVKKSLMFSAIVYLVTVVYAFVSKTLYYKINKVGK